MLSPALFTTLSHSSYWWKVDQEKILAAMNCQAECVRPNQSLTHKDSDVSSLLLGT